MATHTAHESHGWHPLAMIGFTTLLIGGAFSALWVITLTQLPDHKPMNIAYGIIALSLLLTTAAIFTWLTRHLHHSPMLPDNTNAEIKRYLAKVGRG
ncbi:MULTISPECIES: hypothetical protein [unclassified Gordonia (in: high G+C Gram-positive bacteria)]|uniref:hypothetical protein n=1 Tax=unclassified Gordonia (in: high G+C Gram-positive bacteria) TaxID=2657482 RepID=UPI00200048A5|nr:MULTISPECIES: hypothetical protein [unclassified Gordonia (in: high G+C Gram-positive bacteria)]UQE74292.1 hypothetical protein MYK68_16420 [Gordonia sp. PP30]